MPTFVTAVYPTSGTVITRAFAVANLIDPINWLHIMTGNADPPAADRVVVSTSTTATAWAQIPTNAYADASITNVKLALQKVEAASTLSSSFGGLLGANKNGFYLMGAPGDAPVGGRSYYAINIVDYTSPSTANCQLAIDNLDPTQMFIRLIIGGAGTAWHKIWNDGNDGAGSGLDADLLDGQSSAFYATASSVAAVVTFPLQGVCWFETLAQLTAAGANFARYTAGDGRLLVGAGTTFSQTFVEATSYGSNWTPLTGVNVAATGSGPFLASPTGGTTNVDVAGHQHLIPTTTWLPPMRGGIWGRRIT